jgi:hypothetical protein
MRSPDPTVEETAAVLTVEPGLNNLLVPRSIFLSSPLGQALLNDTNLSFEPTGGVTFNGTYWSARAVNTTSNGPGDPNFIWVFAPSNLSESNASVSTATLGGVPGDPSLEAGMESQQVQSVIWANLSATQGSSHGLSGVTELRDLIGGLVLNSTGNLTYDLLNVTGALSTLELPANVLSALANYTAPNNGSYLAPQYDANATARQPGLFAEFLQEVWNTLSGVASTVVNGLETIVSVVWSADIAAQAYVDGAVSGALTSASHGLARLRSQTRSALKGLEADMSWALKQLVKGILEPLFQPLTNTNTAYTQALGSDLTNGNAAKFWSDYSGSFMAIVAGFAVSVTIAMTIMEGICVGTALVVLVIISLVAGVASIAGNSHQSSFSNLNPLRPSVATELGSLLAGSSSAVSTVLTGLATILGAVTTTWATADVLSAATTDTPGWTVAWGTALGVVGLLTASVAQEYASADDAVVSLFFDVGSVIVDWKALEEPSADLQDTVTLLLDVAAGIMDGKVALCPNTW